MHIFQVVLHRNIREIREIRGRYIHAKVVLVNKSWGKNNKKG